MIVTTDGLELEDCEVTKGKPIKRVNINWIRHICTHCEFAGLKFWKSPRRKVFAVPRSNMKGKSRNKKRVWETFMFDSDEDLDLTTPKRAKEEYSVVIRQIESKVCDVREEVEAIKVAISHLNSKSKLPMGILRLIRDSFQCKICLGIPTIIL